MKRALLIAGGTVGGLGAVLAITPPQFTSTQDVSGLTGSLGNGTGAVQTTPSASTSIFGVSLRNTFFSRLDKF